MKVCFVAGTLGRGGAERQLLLMLKGLQQEGASVRVMSLTSGEDYEREIKDLGAKVEFVGQSQNRCRRLWQIVERLRREPVDILQSSHFFANLYVATAGRLLGIRSIGAIRGNLTKAVAANGSFGRWHLRTPAHLIANSRSAMKEAIQNGISRTKIDFVRNVVDARFASGTVARPAGAPVTILFAGRLVPLKRPDIFVKVAARLRDELPELSLRFRIAGDGPVRSETEKLARELGFAGDRMEFLGEVREMESVYQSADVLLLTSEHEGTPNVILEAMSFGVPVVATRVGGVPEILTDGCGFIAEHDDREHLVASTKTLILDRGLRQRMGSCGAEYVRQNHSIRYLGKELTNIYTTLLSR